MQDGVISQINLVVLFSFGITSVAKGVGETTVACSSGNNAGLGCSEFHLYEFFGEGKALILGGVGNRCSVSSVNADSSVFVAFS